MDYRLSPTCLIAALSHNISYTDLEICKILGKTIDRKLQKRKFNILPLYLYWTLVLFLRTKETKT